MRKVDKVSVIELPNCLLLLEKKIDNSDSCSSLSTIYAHRPNNFSPHRQIMSIRSYVIFLALTLSLWTLPTSAAFVEFQNCLSKHTRHDKPLALQLTPQFVNVIFNTSSPDYNLNVTVWVNVTGSTAGSAPRLIIPHSNDTNYWNSNNTKFGGKIEAIPSPDQVNKETTLYSRVNFLSYQPYSEYLSFCDHLTNGSCPLSPVWSVEPSTSHIPQDFPSFGFSYNLYSTYALASLATSFRIKYGDKEASEIGCVMVNITPQIGSKLASIIKFTPVFILASTAVATLLAAIWSPWGTHDTFRWTTNYGRDPDLLRLMTPGFGDCLQYIQFAALTGGLELQYPGFFQPIVSKFTWSTLNFNYSFFEDLSGTKSIVDGIYVTHANYGLERLSQIVGISQIENLWISMVISLLIIMAICLVTIQIGFIIRWINRKLNKVHEEDLRAKNMPFTIGNIIRIVFNYFLLPLVSLSMFQISVSSRTPAYTVGLATMGLFFIVGFTVWLLSTLISTRPKSFLFDDLRTVLLLGPLYNTYSDHAASFAVIPIALTFLRGIAIGAVQVSGLAQLVILSVCEVITILTIHGFRPFHPQTSMNAYHITFSVIKLTTILLMVSFAPSLNVSEVSKSWVGYSILLMHTIVLVVGFWLNAMQTIAEVCARLARASDDGGNVRSGFAEAFCTRQVLSRQPRYDLTSRQSQLSNAAMLDSGSRMDNTGRIRSQSSGSTGILLGRQSLMADNTNIDKFGAIAKNSSAFGESYAFSTLPSTSAGRQARAPSIGADTTSQVDPYFRPPRIRRPTLENISPSTKSRTSWNGEKWPSMDPPEDLFDSAGEGSLKSGQSSPQLNTYKVEENPGQLKADYTTREVDFYYKVRTPSQIASTANRRRKISPAEHIGPATSAIGWFKWITSTKTKEKEKGFEVVRRSRLPPGARPQSNEIDRSAS